MIDKALRKEYMRLRALGWHAVYAIFCARTRVAFEARDDLRVRIVLDEEPYEHGDDTKEQIAKTNERIAREGLWGIVSEAKCSECGNWYSIDAVWGFIGEDWKDSGYDTDVMRAALERVAKRRAS